jgi:site-specific DNA-cytosine methylase
MPRSSTSGKGGTGHLSRADGKTYCLDTGNTNALEITNSRIRRLTPLECERLQTVADNYTNHVSDSQRYKMLGNGWTVDVIAHIFNYIK